MRPRIYIACPISTGNLADNVNAASAAFLALVQAGFAPFCPAWSVYSGFAHGTMMEDNCIGFGSPAGMEGMSHEIWLEVDLAWVEASDLVLRLPGASVGADREVSVCSKERSAGSVFCSGSGRSGGDCRLSGDCFPIDTGTGRTPEI